MMLPIAVYFTARAKALQKLFWFLATLALLYGVFLTNSRGAFLGALSLLGLWALQKYGVKKTMVTAFFMLPVLSIVASKFRTIDAEEESAAGRVEAWYEGFQMLIQNPLFGVGMENFTEHHFLTAHNSYVLILAELGIVGFTTWMSFFLLTFLMLYQLVFYNSLFFKKTLPDTQFTGEVLSPEIVEELLLAKVSLFSLLGFVSTAFFLSRSYSFLPYIYSGLGVSSYYRGLSLIPTLTPVTFSPLFFRLVSISCAYIFFLYLIVKLLL
ncbi:MAG: O-antigen ligase family protein [Methylococcales bacterium]